MFYTKEKNPDWTADIEARLKLAFDTGIENKILKPGSLVVLVTGWQSGSGFTNTVRIISVP